MPQDLTFTTQVSHHTPEGHMLRGQLLSDLVENQDFATTLFVSLTGKTPSAGQAKMLNAVLSIAIDHGVEPASGFVPRVAASTGNNVLTAMATVPLVLGPKHGGAVTSCMELLTQLATKRDVETAAQDLILSYRHNKQRIPGFGHPVYTDQDPRTNQLEALMKSNKLDPDFFNVARTIEYQLEQTIGKKLVLNVDGAIAAVLCTLGIDPLAGDAIFALSRIGGSIAHIVEEKNQAGGVRRLPSASH